MLTSSSFSPPSYTLHPRPEEALAATGPDSTWEGRRRRAATALSGREEAPHPRGRGPLKEGEERLGKEGGGSGGELKRVRRRSDPIEADKDGGAGDRTRKGAEGAGRPTPSCAAAASSAELLGSGPPIAEQAHGHPRPLLSIPRCSARCGRFRTQAQGAGAGG